MKNNDWINNMKLGHCFALAAVLTLLFSLGCVAANDNMTCDDIGLADDGFDSISEEFDLDESQDSSSDDVDLSVKVTRSDRKLQNTTIVDVPFIVTASVSGGIAHNTKVHLVYQDDDDFKYHSYNATCGSYDSKSRIWNIGDLSSSEKASLEILMKFDPKGKNLSAVGVLVIANATTTSNDIDLSNNFLIQSVVYDEGVYYVEKSDDKEGAQHTDHQSSQYSSSVVVRIEDEEEGNASNSQNSEGKSKFNENSGVGQDSRSNSKEDDGSTHIPNNATKEINPDIFTKSVNSITNVLPQVSDSLGDVIGNIFNPDENHDNPSKYIEGIQAYDYTKVPLLIFSLFLILMIGLFGYDKFKSLR